MSIELQPDKPVFPISVAADLVGLNCATLRTYEKEGLLTLARRGTAKRPYSLRDVERLQFLFYLTRVQRIGIPGCRYILDLLDRLCEEDRKALLAEAAKAVRELPDSAPEEDVVPPPATEEPSPKAAAGRKRTTKPKA